MANSTFYFFSSKFKGFHTPFLSFHTMFPAAVRCWKMIICLIVFSRSLRWTRLSKLLLTGIDNLLVLACLFDPPTTNFLAHFSHTGYTGYSLYFDIFTGTTDCWWKAYVTSEIIVSYRQKSLFQKKEFRIYLNKLILNINIWLAVVVYYITL